MPNLKDTPESIISAVKDIMMKNQNLYQQDLESRFVQKSPAEIEAQTQNNTVNVPEPGSQDVDPESIIPGSSGQ